MKMRNSVMRGRHAIPLALIILFAGLLTNFNRARLAPPPVSQELRFGFTPVLSEPEMRAEFEPLMNYLSVAIVQKVRLYIAIDYDDLRTQMENGSVDIGRLLPFSYVDVAKRRKDR